jgi:hypothetical protein
MSCNSMAINWFVAKLCSFFYPPIVLLVTIEEEKLKYFETLYSLCRF